jgi:hypothetical protein
MHIGRVIMPAVNLYLTQEQYVRMAGIAGHKASTLVGEIQRAVDAWIKENDPLEEPKDE